MKTVCIDQPISWFRLEQYRLGGLSGPERSAISEHLDRCPACESCYTETGPARALAPLPSPSGIAGNSEPYPRRARLARGRIQLSIPWRAAAVAISAAIVAFALWVNSSAIRSAGGHLRPSSMNVKGGTLALQLVRERANA